MTKPKLLKINPGGKLRSVTVVEMIDPRYGFSQGEIFHLGNAEIRYDPKESNGQLNIRHPWGLDDERDRAYFFCMDIFSLTLEHMNEGFHRYSAWVSDTVKLYTEDNNPYLGLTKDTVDEDEEFPYTPFETTLKEAIGVKGPFMIKMTVYSAGSYNVKSFFKEKK